MHVECVAGGVAHQFRINLVGCKQRGAPRLFVFLAHRRPHIGDDQVGIPDSDGRIVFDMHPVAVSVEQSFVRLKGWWARNAQFEIELAGRIDIGLAHVVSVAYPADAATCDIATVFEPGLHIREQLAGVKIVGQAVDNGNGGMRGEAFHDIVLVSANHDDVDHGGNHPCAVFNGFASSQLSIVR